MQEFDSLVAMLRKELPQLLAVYCFGSAVTGDTRNGSDLDVAILTDGALSRGVLFDLAQELAAAFSRDVDLIDLRAASTVFRATVVSTGKRVYCTDLRACDAFEDLALSSYARLNEERCGILGDIKERGQIHG